MRDRGKGRGLACRGPEVLWREAQGRRRWEGSAQVRPVARAPMGMYRVPAPPPSSPASAAPGGLLSWDEGASELVQSTHTALVARLPLSMYRVLFPSPQSSLCCYWVSLRDSVLGGKGAPEHVQSAFSAPQAQPWLLLGLLARGNSCPESKGAAAHVQSALPQTQPSTSYLRELLYWRKGSLSM